MKCPNCGVENKKTNSECKSCKQPLHTVDNKEQETKLHEDLKEELKKELKADLTIEIQDLKEDIAKELIKENKLKPRKQKNIFTRIWFTFKLFLFLILIGIIALVVYVYGFYDYEEYYSDAINRYYETENDTYLDNIKLFFRVYKYDDSKISKAQSKGNEVINNLLEEIEKKEYLNNNDKIEEINNLTEIIEKLYNDTEVSGHRVISKKNYNDLNYKLKELTNIDYNTENVTSNENEEKIDDEITIPEKEEDNKYDVSNMKSINYQKALELFKSDNSSIIYFGRETCSHCVDFVPVLNKISKEKNITIYYIDISNFDSEEKGFNELKKKLDIVHPTYEETYGELIGYTPMTVIIKGKKQVDGTLGKVAYSDYLEIVNKYF